jgi:hypothetical protein
MNGSRNSHNADLQFAIIAHRGITLRKCFAATAPKGRIARPAMGGTDAIGGARRNALLTTLWNRPIAAGFCNWFNRIAISRW